MSEILTGSRVLLLATITYLLSSFPAYSQEYSYAHYDVDKGLAGSVVYDGVEDKDGFLWFATETGVSRFDGTHFRNFTKADGLPDNDIPRLYVDSKNRVWMLPFHNSICYYRNGKIYTKDNDSLLKQLRVDGQLHEIAEDRQGNLMIRGTSVFYFIRGNSIKEVRQIDDSHFLTGKLGLNAGGQFMSIVIPLRVPTKIQLYTFGAEGQPLGKVEYRYKPVSNLSIFLGMDYSIFRQHDYVIFKHVTNRDSLRVATPDGFNGISAIDDTLCTLNSSNGAIFYNTKTRQALQHVLKGKTVNKVLRDSEGNSWFLTGGSGIFRVGSFEFTNYRFTARGSEALAIHSLYKNGRTLYAGSEKSMLFSIDVPTRQVTAHPIKNATISSKITAITTYPSGRMLLGTDDGLYDYGPQGPVRHPGIYLAVKTLHKFGNEILVSTHAGIIAVYDYALFSDLDLQIRSTSSYKIGDLYYTGTINGLYSVDSRCHTTWLGQSLPLLRNRITSLEGGPDSTLWIGTHGDGIIGYRHGKVICNIRQSDGLTSDICRTLFVHGGDIWVGTDKGLNRVRYEQGKPIITTFTRADGLIADIVNTLYVDSTNVYVGTPAGLTTFDADKISHNSWCKLRITGIQATDREWSPTDADISLSPSANAIRFSYAGISYRSAGDISYKYRLVGLDDAWQATRETFLNYPALPAGNYELQLMAVNKFGVESESISIAFRVEKTLWEMTWFRILAIIIIWALVWIFVHHRIKKIKRQNDEKMQTSKRIADLEQMALKSQMNPHFIFNSLNSVQQYVIDKDIVGANKFITEFSQLIRLTLDISSKTRISLYEEISYLTTYLELEKTKFEDKFTYQVELSSDIDTAAWFIPPMILQPYVENSIRHGVRNRPDKLGKISIRFSTDDRYLICCVEDNGIGRKKASQYKSAMAIEYQSKGMTLTARRIEMLNKHLRNQVLIEIEDLENNQVPAGTRVTLRFPREDAAGR